MASIRDQLLFLVIWPEATKLQLFEIMLKHWSEAVCTLLLSAAGSVTAVACVAASRRPAAPGNGKHTDQTRRPPVGPAHPSIYFFIFSPFFFSLSFIGFTYFLLLSIPSLSTRIVPLRFQAAGRRRRPNLGLVCVLLCNLCYLYSLVKELLNLDCDVLFYLV